PRQNLRILPSLSLSATDEQVGEYVSDRGKNLAATRAEFADVDGSDVKYVVSLRQCRRMGHRKMNFMAARVCQLQTLRVDKGERQWLPALARTHAQALAFRFGRHSLALLRTTTKRIGLLLSLSSAWLTSLLMVERGHIIATKKGESMIDLNGKRALVTGGSRGIGAAIALALAENGADVAFTYQNSISKAESVAASIQGTGRCAIAIKANSADPEAITRSVTEAVSALGGLDILVNNAAIGLNGMIADINLDDYQALMDINVRGPVLFAKAVIPHLAAGGRIISIGSGLAERGPLARTRPQRNHCESGPAWLDRYRGKSGRWPSGRFPAKHVVAGTFRRTA
nr:short-chain dehydrogenase/reductase SDR [Tanacetum cinerariifolium]